MPNSPYIQIVFTLVNQRRWLCMEQAAGFQLQYTRVDVRTIRIRYSYSGASGDHAHRPTAHPSRMSRATTTSSAPPALALLGTAAASARNSLARMRTVTRWPGGTSGGVQGCTAAPCRLVVVALMLISSSLVITFLQQQRGLDAQLPMDIYRSDDEHTLRYHRSI